MSISNFITIENVVGMMMFLFPGYVIGDIIDKTYPPKRFNACTYIFRYFLYSIIHRLIFSLFFINLNLNDYLKFIIIYLLAVILGLLLALIKKKELVDYILKLMKFNSISSIESAWDRCFYNAQKCFVIVTLIDGTIIYGCCYSDKSVASSDIEYRDLYIETVYTVNENYKWVLEENCKGYYIASGQIKTIEFINWEVNDEK